MILQQEMSAPARHRWTREEYYAIARAGVFVGRRVELIDGEIFDMSPQGASHAMALMLGMKALERAFPDKVIRPQLPLSIAGDCDPEPDLAVVEGTPRDYPSGHPDWALLVVEIADSTLAFDRTRKASLYARAGIPEYWIVNLGLHQLEVHRQPRPAEDPSTAGYAEIQILRADDVVQPYMAVQSIVVKELLP